MDGRGTGWAGEVLILRTLLLALALSSCTAAPPREEAPRAAIVAGWPVIPVDARFGQPSAVDIDAQGRVFVLQRAGREWIEPFPAAPIAEPTVFVFDGPSGRLLARWGAGKFVMPHGLSVDPEGKVWITDPGREQVFRFSANGELELAIGTDGVSGDDATHFGRPTDVAFNGGHVIVADGYLNGRIVTFDREGRFVGQFGSRGSGEGQFMVPHSIAANYSRLLVADRENARTQEFTRGELVRARPMPRGGHPYAAKPLPGEGMVTLEGRDGSNRGGALLRFWNRQGELIRTLDASAPDGPSKGHDLALGSDGAIYVADVDAGRVVKIAPEGQGR